jgi:hypothetical protein
MLRSQHFSIVGIDEVDISGEGIAMIACSLPPSTESVVELHQREPLVELRLRKIEFR